MRLVQTAVKAPAHRDVNGLRRIVGSIRCWLALRSFDPVLLRDAALRTEQVLAPFFVTPPFYPDWDLVRPSNERFDGPAMANHFRWHPGTDFGVVFNLVWQLRGVMVLAAIGLLAILLPFF